jgi:ribonuclease PH
VDQADARGRQGRGPETLRPVSLERGAAPYAEGSCLAAFGATRVLCTASVEEGVPAWRRGTGEGWITAEYAMLPRATTTRSSRERGSGGVGGRTQEIQRLIGRSVRAMLDGFTFGEYTIRVDCDVLQADGGTRTAAITGASVAVSDAFAWLARSGRIAATPVRRRVAAISVGIVDGEPRLDLEYTEDVRAAVDMNVVMATEAGVARFVEVQGTGEHGTFDRGQLDALLALAVSGIERLDALQQAVLTDARPGGAPGAGHS